MKVSLDWVRFINQKYGCADDPAADGVEKLVERIGAQLGAVDEIIDLGKRYEGIVVAKVVSVEKHPNADKLTICLIDDGKAAQDVERDEQGHVQVVCGAPNVAAGQLVAWIPPGVIVPSTVGKDPFKLESREIRGVISHGMIASPKELGLGDDHAGILVIDEPAEPGQPFAEAYGLDDHIIDIENKMFTHRPDLFGMLGIARELAGIQGQKFKSPDWYSLDVKLPEPEGETLKLEVKNEVPELVPRFMAVAINNVSVKPSPGWLQSTLIKSGIKPINNIVDLTNFFMLETAQPLHAYDYDKLARQTGGATLGVRLGKEGEELELLGSKKIKLAGGEVVITDGNRPVGLGGVMGGADTEVDETTRNIVLEAANFDMNTTRTTARQHGLFTEAVLRFTKGQSPLQTRPVLIKAVDDITELTGGHLASELMDIVDCDKINVASDGWIDKEVTTDLEFINSRLGLKLTTEEVTRLLKNVEFGVDINGENMIFYAPFWRTDIEIAEDVVEEVGRLYGYDHLPKVLPKRSISPAPKDKLIEFKSRLRGILTSAGANEVLSYSFVHESLMQKAGQDPQKAYRLRNALSPDLQYYRMSLTPSLLEKVHPNIKAGFDAFALFEIGKAYVKDLLDEEKLPKELERLSVVVAGKDAASAPYFAAKKICDFLLRELNISSVRYAAIDPAAKFKTVTYYEPLRAANLHAGDSVIGRLGEFSLAVRDGFKLPAFCAGFELHVDELASLASPINYKSINRFPSVEQDICLRVSTDKTYAELTKFVENYLRQSANESGYEHKIKPLDIFQRPEDKDHKQVTWRIRLWHPKRTLTTTEVNKLLDDLATSASSVLGAVRI